jgi:Uma2 family endonuclease
MSVLAPVPASTEIVYPESDGRPMADNTLQFRWIVTIEGGLETQFADDPNVFVAGDLLWYPVEGHSEISTAPDVIVAVGRPRGDRRSYLQWREGNIPPQVVFEVLSETNTVPQMNRKFHFYQRYGVEEYYLFDPDRQELQGWRRVGEWLEEIPEMNGWVSPRLGIRFDLSSGELQIFGSDGRRFLSYQELAAQREREQQEAERQRQEAEHQRQEAEHQRQEAEHQRQEAEHQRQEAERAQQQATEAASKAERLAAQLRALGIEPEA